MQKIVVDSTGAERKLPRKLLPTGGLLALCLIWAVGWVKSDLQPGASGLWSLTPLTAQAALLGALAAVAGSAALVRRTEWPVWTIAAKAVLVGVGLFVVPAILTNVGEGRIDDATRVALFSLTPLLAVIFEPYLGIDAREDDGGRAGFLAAMAAIAGTFLVFPVELPRSYAAGFVMLAVVATATLIAAANCAAVRLARESASLLMFTSVVSGSAAVLLGIMGSVFPDDPARAVPLGWWAGLDLVALALLFWLMPRMNAVQMTTRFLIAPLMANLMSLALLRPHVDVQSWIGLMLITAGSVRLLIVPAESGRSGLLTLGRG